MSKASLKKEAEQLRGYLEESDTDSQVITDFRNHPGWAMVETIMGEYASRSHAEFVAGDKGADDYRAECRVIEFLRGTMMAVAEHGEAAARELLDRGWTE